MRLRRVALCALAVAALLTVACVEQVGGNVPAGGATSTVPERERFLRRAYLDLTGAPPSDAELVAGVERLAAGAAARPELVADLIASEAFATTFVAELENRVFAGAEMEGQVQFVCALARAFEPECLGCAPDTTDQCADCDCAVLVTVRAERDRFREAADDLLAGASTGELEHRYAGSVTLRRTRGTVPEIVDGLFRLALGRGAGTDELANGFRMTIGTFLPDNPAGLLFHRYGSTVDDLVAIVYESEPYREAVVGGVLRRYLGRSASATELRHFIAQLDPDSPDARPVIEAVVSSREYFAQ